MGFLPARKLLARPIITAVTLFTHTLLLQNWHLVKLAVQRGLLPVRFPITNPVFKAFLGS